MENIWKFQLEVKDEQVIEIPKSGTILKVGSIGDEMFLWVSVNPAAEKVKRTFRIVGTGHEYDHDGLTYLGTDYMMGGKIVWHVFELTD